MLKVRDNQPQPEIMTSKEDLSRHDREIAEIRAIQKRTEESIAKLASARAKEKAVAALMLATEPRAY